MKKMKVKKGSALRAQNIAQLQTSVSEIGPILCTSSESTQNGASASIVNDLQPAVNTILCTSSLISRKGKKDSVKDRFSKTVHNVHKVHKTPHEGADDCDPWEAWYVENFGDPMGDAYEPDVMAMLAQFDITEQRTISDADVIRAGSMMRSRGDRSFLAMMTPITASDYVWTEDPITKQWSTRAKFPGE
jgi:hypothetical protein